MSSTRRDNQNMKEHIDAEIEALTDMSAAGVVDKTVVQVENSF